MLFLTVFFIIPVQIENAGLTLAVVIPAGAPMKIANKAIEILPVVTDKLMTYQNSQKKQYIY